MPRVRKGRIKRFRRRLGGILLSAIGPPLLRLYAATWKLERLNYERWEELAKGEGVLGCLWHGRLLAAWPTHRNQGVHVLVSPSGDGEIIAQLLERTGYGTLRGSSNRQPTRALKGVVDFLRDRGGRVVVTPDGPRGPRHSIQPSVPFIASKTGLPILAGGVAVDRFWQFGSWDRFVLPKPFARIYACYGEVMHVPPDADADELAAMADRVREAMLDAERQAFAAAGVEPDW